MKGIKLEKIKVAHSDERRDILEMFNGDFDCKQIKILKIRKNNMLGNHYHTYRENRYLLKGKAKYYLKNVHTGEEEQFLMNEGEMMMTDPYIAHTGEFLEDSIMIEGTEEVYKSAKHNDIVCRFK